MSRRGIHPLLMGLDRPARDKDNNQKSDSAAMSQLSESAFCVLKAKGWTPKNQPESVNLQQVDPHSYEHSDQYARV